MYDVYNGNNLQFKMIYREGIAIMIIAVDVYYTSRCCPAHTEYVRGIPISTSAEIAG